MKRANIWLIVVAGLGLVAGAAAALLFWLVVTRPADLVNLAVLR